MNKNNLDPKNLHPNELQFFEAFKEQFDKAISVACIDSLTDFNNCIEHGVKKYENGSSTEELYNYEKTKGCYEEYKHFDKCIKNIANQALDVPEIANLFKNRQVSVPRSKFLQMLIREYEI
jgi:hypothetical protein